MNENLNLKDVKKQIENLNFEENEPLEIDPKVVSKDLLERGKKSGKLSIQEVAVALEELNFDADQITKLYEKFEQYNIELVDDLEEDLDIDLSLDIGINDNAGTAMTIDSVNIDEAQVFRLLLPFSQACCT